MKYAKKQSVVSPEYQGESFTKGLGKESGAIWDANEVGYYQLINDAGLVVSTNDLIKSSDDLSLIASIPASDTIDLEGSYLLLFNLKDSVEAEFDDVIGEYKMSYKVRSA